MKKRCGFRFTKRLLSVALAAALVCQLFGLPVLALGVSDTVGSSGCTHVHNETCGYIQAEEGTPCKHTLGVHDDTCGYSVGTEEIPCDMYCRGGDNHAEGCAYRPAQEGMPCGHTEHDENCVYAPAVEGTPCNHVHDETCGGLEPGASVPVTVAKLDALPGDALIQEFVLGTITSQTDVNLPDILTGEDTKGSPLTIEGVVWTCGNFDPEQAGQYTFTCVLPEGYEAADGLEPPVITVAVRPVMDALMSPASNDIQNPAYIVVITSVSSSGSSGSSTSPSVEARLLQNGSVIQTLTTSSDPNNSCFIAPGPGTYTVEVGGKREENGRYYTLQSQEITITDDYEEFSVASFILKPYNVPGSGSLNIKVVVNRHNYYPGMIVQVFQGKEFLFDERTNDRGIADIVGLTPGSYRVVLPAQDVITSDKEQLNFARQETTVTVPEGGTCDFTFSLNPVSDPDKYGILGDVLYSSYRLENVPVELYNLDNNLVTKTVSADGGGFHLLNIVPGTYRLHVPAGWYQAGVFFQECNEQITIKDKDVTQNLYLAPSGEGSLSLSGTILTADGPLSIPFDVKLTGEWGEPIATTVTKGSTGQYTFDKLNPGTYHVVVGNITISDIYYYETSTTFTLDENNITDANITLKSEEALVEVEALEANGVKGLETSTQITLKFDVPIPLTLDSITIKAGEGFSANKVRLVDEGLIKTDWVLEIENVTTPEKVGSGSFMVLIEVPGYQFTGNQQKPVTINRRLTPIAPTNLAAKAFDGQVILFWTAPGDNGGSVITGYQYLMSPGSGDWQDIPNSSTAAFYTVKGLTNDTEYTFQVRAVNSAGAGIASNSAIATPTAAATVPGAPTDLKAEAGDKQVKLTWAAPASDGGSAITKYQYKVSPGAGNWTDILNSATATTYTVTGLTNGTEYTLQVRAVNEKGEGAASNTAKATAAAATYTLTVINGTDRTNKGPYIEGARVSIKADDAPAGYRFDKWVSLGSGRFENDQSAETIFTMPGADVKIEAIFINETDPGHSHTFDSAWSYDENSHWHACTAGDGVRSKQAAHIASEWTIDKPATETEAGSQYKACTVCYYVLQKETIAPTGPNYPLHTLEDPDTGVKVSGYFTDDAVLVVKDRLLHAKGICDVCDDIRARQDKGELIVLYDLSLSSGSYTGDLDVQIPVDAKYDGQTVLLLHCKDKVLESHTVTVENGVAKGTFSSLSPFAAAVQPSSTTTINDSTIPRTGDTASPLPWLPAMLAALLGGASLLFYRKRRYTKRHG